MKHCSPALLKKWQEILGKKSLILLVSQVFALCNHLQSHHYYRSIIFLCICCYNILQEQLRRIQITALSATNAIEVVVCWISYLNL